MPPVNRRPAAPATRRAAPSVRAPAPRSERQITSTSYSGAAGIARAQQEEERAEAERAARSSMSGVPLRYFTPVGTTQEIIVVDDQPSFFRFEHNMRDRDGKWRLYSGCVNEHANCPVCVANPDKPPYFAMYLTIIDLTPFVNRDGDEIEWSKKLLVVKPMQQKKILRLLERHGTLRGMHLEMTRDGDKDASIGGDIEFIDFYEEDDLETFVTTYVNAKNEEVEILGYEPVNYQEAFPEQTEEQLAAIAGGRVNNHSAADRNIGRSRGGDDWSQDRPRGGSRPARTAARPAARAEEPAPARGPAARRTARTEPAEDIEYTEVEGEGEAEAGDPPQRAARPAARTAAPAARPASRPAPRQASRPARQERPADTEYGDDLLPEEDPPQRGRAATNMADRRSQLRGGRR